jgi:hypothetical protein
MTALIEVVGWLGALAVLAAYALVSTERRDPFGGRQPHLDWHWRVCTRLDASPADIGTHGAALRNDAAHGPGARVHDDALVRAGAEQPAAQAQSERFTIRGRQRRDVGAGRPLLLEKRRPEVIE